MADALIILPTFNERENIGTLIDAIFSQPRDLHVLVVDDESPDGTAEAVREKQQEYGTDRIHLVVRTEGKAGRGTACIHGFGIARDKGYTTVIEMDADLSHDPNDIPRLLDKLSEADFVIASKNMPGSAITGWPWHRTLLSKAANMYVHMILHIPISDYTNGFRCYGPRTVQLLPDLEIEGTGFTVIPQVTYQLYKAGMRVAEIPTVFTNRRLGESNMGPREIFESLLATIRVRSKTAHIHISQLIRFAVTGFSNLFLDLVLLALCVELLELPIAIAGPAVSTIVIINVFFMHKFWTFRNGEKRYASQGMKFALVYGTSFILVNVLTWYFVEIMGIWYILSRIVAVFICALWNYLWMHFHIFSRKSVLP